MSDSFNTSSGSQQSLLENITGLGGGSNGGSRDPVRLIGGQTAWMVVTLGMLLGLQLFSLELYFIVSFIGLLINKLLFAPLERVGHWWRIVNLITYIGFLVLSYIIYVQIQLAIAQ